MGGSCGVAVASLKKALPLDTHIIDLGYLASELRGTITLEDTGNSGVPTFHDNFYEFISVDDYESGQRQTIRLDQLKIGKQYYVIITTAAGLVVGIIAYISYNYLVSKVDKVVFQLEAKTTDFLDILHHNE